jgi:hypothetical protein
VTTLQLVTIGASETIHIRGLASADQLAHDGVNGRAGVSKTRSSCPALSRAIARSKSLRGVGYEYPESELALLLAGMEFLRETYGWNPCKTCEGEANIQKGSK